MATSARRTDGRRLDELRPMRITRSYLKTAAGSVLIELGDTKVICAVTIDDSVPPFLRGKNEGWLSAEYGMLPRSSHERIPRESVRGRIGGRTHEIQRMIGRSLRAVMNLASLGEHTLWIDCDVVQADGGTRTAAITGAFVALADAMTRARHEGRIEGIPINDYLAAVSVGRVDGRSMLDLCYSEDSNAAVDMNIVMTGGGKFVEIQGTAEKHPFGYSDLERLTALGRKGINQMIDYQKKLLKGLRLGGA
jgi:ribonuclease PH